MKRLCNLLFISLFSLALFGCDDVSKLKLKQLPAKAVILAFGDSLTYGTGVNPDIESYPAILSNLSGYKIINAGIPGEVSTEGAMRIDMTLQQYHPQLVILCHGGNDLIRKQNRKQLENNLTSMIQKIRASGAQIMMLSVPRPGFLVDPDPLYLQVAEKEQVLLENHIIADLETQPDMKSDPIHFNAEGYQALATKVYLLLQQSGAI